jgi:hypothetical protein
VVANSYPTDRAKEARLAPAATAGGSRAEILEATGMKLDMNDENDENDQVPTLLRDSHMCELRLPATASLSSRAIFPLPLGEGMTQTS